MSEKTIESVMEEDRRFEPPKQFSERARIKSMEQYQKMYDESIKDPVAFWGKHADVLHWFAKWHNVFSWDVKDAKIKWYEGGKLNACYNCVDRHALGPNRNKAAIIWQGENDEDVKTYTYQQLLYEVSRFANVLKSKGVQKGDRVSIYLPMVPELVISMLACARIGAIHSVVFGGFSSESLRDRIADSECKVLITADGNHRGGKLISLKQNADLALEGLVKGTSGEERHRGEARRQRGRSWKRAGTPGTTMRSRTSPLCANRSGWTRRIRCSSSTPPDRPESRRACCTPPAATWSTPP